MLFAWYSDGIRMVFEWYSDGLRLYLNTTTNVDCVNYQCKHRINNTSKLTSRLQSTINRNHIEKHNTVGIVLPIFHIDHSFL